MGFELRAFLGPSPVLRTWEGQFPSALTCDLSGGLALVPVTGGLLAEMGSRLACPIGEAAARWASGASVAGPIAFVDLGEFGNMSHEEGTLWSNRRKALSGVALAPILAHFREHGIGEGTTPDDLERQRGEDAAARWVAAERRRRSAAGG